MIVTRKFVRVTIMEENEFTPHQTNPDGESKAKQDKKSTATSKTKQVRSNGLIASIQAIDWKNARVVFGTLLLVYSLFLLLACISYFITWQIDQDKIIGKSFFEFMFQSEMEPMANWLGRFGAWTAHFFVYNLFGVSSIGFAFIFFILGFKVLFEKNLLPIWKSISTTFLFILWGSYFFGYFSDKLNYLGGKFGFSLNEWSTMTFGTIPTMVIILSLLYIVITITLNPNYTEIFNYLFNREPKLSTTIGDDTQPISETSGYHDAFDDILIVNPIKEEEIKQDVVSETVDFSDDEEDFIDDSLSEIEVVYKDPTEELPSADDEFEIELPVEEDVFIPTNINSPSPPLNDEENLAELLVSQHGEYDPTKDLEGYMLPPIDLMKEYGSGGVSVNKEELETNKDRIVQTLSHYKIDIAKIKATVGPTVTLYEIVPAPGVRISKIKNLEDDIALSLSALGIRIIAPIPGKGTIGIEVPNSNPEMVSMRSLIASEKFQNFDGELPIVMGKTITNETYVFDLTKMPHLLVAGATGQGKSVGLNAILISILYKKHPAQVKFVLVDPKKVELTLYNKIERHFLAKLPGEEDAIITDTSKVVNTLNSLCIEMDERYELLKDAGVRTIKEYNAKFIGRRLNPEKGHRYLPYIVVLIDEFADLIMTAGKEVEHPIARIAQLARAIGIHLIVATQRPSVNVITGMIKANFPARIAFRVLSKIDSRTILDASGADQLIGRGDMLISTGSDMKRLQCGFVDTPEVEDICSFIGDQRAYPEALLLPEYIPEGGEGVGDFDMNEIDPMFVESARIVVINQQGSASLLQRKLKLGYNRAGRIVDQLEGMGIIGSFQGSKAREVLYSDIESLDDLLRTKGLI
jgi:S-DNA-T family DNA segregation ATPase FtsK/SpoIIIE